MTFHIGNGPRILETNHRCRKSGNQNRKKNKLGTCFLGRFSPLQEHTSMYVCVYIDNHNIEIQWYTVDMLYTYDIILVYKRVTTANDHTNMGWMLLLSVISKVQNHCQEGCWENSCHGTVIFSRHMLTVSWYRGVFLITDPNEYNRFFCGPITQQNAIQF